MVFELSTTRPAPVFSSRFEMFVKDVTVASTSPRPDANGAVGGMVRIDQHDYFDYFVPETLLVEWRLFMSEGS